MCPQSRTVQWQRDKRGYMPMQQYLSDLRNFRAQILTVFDKITIIQSQLTSSYAGKCFKIVMQHIERGNHAGASCVSFSSP